jgi:peptidoglycan/xylan/chitin deacetylase (PgdA/CDA1 family)
VSVANFSAQMAALAASGAAVLPLDEFESLRRAGRLPPRATAITFDDGYADNLLTAAPILARHALPATVFVSTGMIGARGEFWWDDVERIAATPAQRDLPIAGVSWSGDDGEPIEAGNWNIFSPAPPNARQRLYNVLQAELRARRGADRERALDSLREWAGVPPVGRASHRTLTRDELLELAALPRMQIGAHTVSHPALSALTPAEQVVELAHSRIALEGILRRNVVAAAYPFGTHAEVSRATLGAARRAEFDYALANEPGVAWRLSPRFRIPRVVVRDWPADEFMKRLESWWSGTA